MTKKEKIREELKILVEERTNIMAALQKEDSEFRYCYQRWYTKAVKALESLAPDRLKEFRSYYEIDPQRKEFGYGTYAIQDYMLAVVPGNIIGFNAKEVTSTCFDIQVAILASIAERIDSVLANIEGEIYAELQDNEIATARQLAKINLRAAGALLGVLIEGHLQKVASTHGLKIAKKNPTISDLNDPLKAAGVVDMPAWSKILHLATIRNLCSHKKDTEPTKEQIEELIQGAEWLTKNIF